MLLICKPDDNEKECIAEAIQKGYKKVILIYNINKKLNKELFDKKTTYLDSNIEIMRALDVKNAKETKINGFEYYFQLGTMKKGFLPGITHVYDNEREESKDFIHQRRGGLNHILLRECKAKNITVVFNMARVNPKVMGRLQQNIKLTRKIGVNMSPAYFTSDSNRLPAKKDVEALWNVLQ